MSRLGWLSYDISGKCPECGTNGLLSFSLEQRYWLCANGHRCVPAHGDEEMREWPTSPPWQAVAASQAA